MLEQTQGHCVRIENGILVYSIADVGRQANNYLDQKSCIEINSSGVSYIYMLTFDINSYG